MSMTFNPLSGNFETKEPGPQGPAGTVSAAGDGSPGAPSISFASDPDTGIYKYASESIAVSTGGTGKLFIDSNGRVGIGASTPGDLVEVKTGLDRSLLIRGNRTSLPVDLFAGNPAAGYGLRDMSFSANSITFGTGSSGGTTASPHMHLTSTGRLGLGTSFPGSAFHVNSTNNFTIAGTVQTNAANSYISFVDTGTTAGQVRCGSEGNKFVVNAGGNRALTIDAATNAEFAGGVTADYFATNTTSGFFNFYRNQGATSAVNSVWGTTGGAQTIKFYNDGASEFAGQAVVGSNTAGASKVRIDPTGYVNIQSTASAGEALRLYDNSSTLKTTLFADGSSSFAGGQTAITSSGVIDIQSTTAAADASTLFRCGSTNATAGANAFVVKANGSSSFAGNVGIGATDTLTNKLFVDGGNVRIDGAPSTDAVLQIRGDNSTSSSTDAVLSFVSYLNSNSGGSNADIRVTNAGGSYGEMIFSTRRGSGANTEAMRLTSDGTIQLRNSPGIDFSQIQTNASGMSSELLDSYEEGTFTPVLLFGSSTTGITYNARAGFYVKVGKVVHAWVYINLSSKGTATGAAAISQFPFTSEDITVGGLGNWPGAKPSRRQNQFSTDLAVTMIKASVNAAVTDGGGVSVTDASFSNGTILEFALCYRAA